MPPHKHATQNVCLHAPHPFYGELPATALTGSLHLLALGPEYKNQNMVFANSTGHPLDQINISRRHFKPILKAAGLSNDFRVYDLRHSCATLLLAAGENPKVVSERLGHASVALTLDIYSHVLPSMQKQAAERLEAILFNR